MALIELHFPADWQYVQKLRPFVQAFVSIGQDRNDLASRVAMTAAELSENAVKYSTGPEARLRLDVDAQGNVSIETLNEASPEHIEELGRIVHEIEVDDPLEAYARILLSAAQDDSSSESKVGLARIRCEGRMSVRCEISGNQVRMIAEASPETPLKLVAGGLGGA